MPKLFLRAAAVAVALIAGAMMGPEARAAGALAVGQCGAYGHAFDFGSSRDAIDAAKRQCSGDCKAIPMTRACAALSIDMANPCGAHGYAVSSKISSALNSATRNCYKFGGKDCVIRAWACDARG